MKNSIWVDPFACKTAYHDPQNALSDFVSAAKHGVITLDRFSECVQPCSIKHDSILSLKQKAGSIDSRFLSISHTECSSLVKIGGMPLTLWASANFATT